MSKDTDDFVENILSAQQWLRILLIVGFGILSWLLRFVQIVIVLIQALFALITGRDNINMRKAGTLLSLYQAHIWLYMNYSTDVKPYPFTDLPESGSDLDRDIKSLYEDYADGRHEETNDGPTSGPASTQPGMQASASTATARTSNSDDDVFSDISFTSGSTASRKKQGDNAPSQDADDNSGFERQDDSDPDSKRPA